MKNGSVRYTKFLIILVSLITLPSIAQSIQNPLPGILSIIPAQWSYSIDVPSDSNQWPGGLDKPLFNASFTDTINLITDCFNLPFHPTLKLCFYPVSQQATIEELIEKFSLFSWCIPVTYLKSSQYFIVTSPCYINNGCSSTDAKNMIAPLDNALAGYFNPVKHIALRDSAVIDLHVFSGRVDPRFVIYDSVNISLIQKKIDSLEIKLGTNGISFSKKSFWRPGMRVTYCPLPSRNRAYFPFELGSDSIACTYPNYTRVMSIKDRYFHQFIIDILVKENAISIQGTDTVKASDFFDSFNIFTAASYDKQPINHDSNTKKIRLLRSIGKSLELQNPAPQKTSVTLFDVQGRMIDILFSGMLPSGLSKINLSGKTAVNGTRIVRIQTYEYCTYLTFTNF